MRAPPAYWNGVFRLNDVLGAIRSGRWLVLAGLVAGLAGGGALVATAAPSYVSSTELLVSVTRTPDAPAAYQGSLFIRERIDTYARLLTTTQLTQRVVDELGIPSSAEEIAGRVDALQVPDTDIIELTVTDDSPERAQAIAASLGRQLADQVAELETTDETQGAVLEVRTVEPATFEPGPVTPQLPRSLVVGGGLGLLAGVALALVRHRLDRTVRSSEAVQDATGSTVVLRLYVDRALSRPPLPAHLHGPSATAKALRSIRLALEHGPGGGGRRVVVVTSAAPGEGKSTVAIGLALSLARAGSRVLLVDGNLWRPRLPPYLGLTTTEGGLSDVLARGVDHQQVTVPTDQPGLDVLPAGPMPEDPGELLDSAAMRALLRTVRQAYDHVLVDAPALLPLVDAAALGALADGCLLVVRYGRTRHEELAEAAAALSAVDARLLGSVLNALPASAAARAERRRYRADTGRRRSLRARSRSHRPPDPGETEIPSPRVERPDSYGRPHPERADDIPA